MSFAQFTGCGYGSYWRGVLFRQTYKQLGDVVVKSQRWFREFYPDATFNQSSYTWEWPDGETLLFRQMKVGSDYDNYHGHEYPWIAFEELTNWPNSDCYDSMFSCLRSSRADMPRMIRATANPFGVGHNWVKKRFQLGNEGTGRNAIIVQGKRRRVAIHGNLLENKKLMDADPEYIEALRNITSEPKRKAWLEGSWDIVAGGMFDDVWDPQTHLLEPFKIPASWIVRRAFDWGSSKPFSVGWWARADGTPAHLADGSIRHFAKGSLIRIAEWYGWNGDANEGTRALMSNIAKGILEREASMGVNGNMRGRVRPGPADSSIFDVVNGKCIATDSNTAGVRWLPANKGHGTRKNGWERMRVMLGNACEIEDAGLFCFDTLRDGFIRTVPNLPRDVDDMDDVDTDAEDHVGDETRYMVLHNDIFGSQEEMH